METILVVDSEADALSSLGGVLNRFGYRVIAASDAPEALSAVNSEARLDLVITECRMPDMDGLELVSSIREARPHVPVIMLTGSGNVETYIRAVSLGVFEYVNKPFVEKEFGRIVKTAIRSVQGSRWHPAAP